MKSLVNNLKTIRDALLTVDQEAVYHYQRPKRENLTRYIIWAEEGETNSLMVGNHKAEQQISGTVDLYTATEFDTWADDIQEALDALDHVAWELDSVQYEDETGLIHYAWTFTVV